MKQLQYRWNYSKDQQLRESLYPLFEKVFGINVETLKDFYSRGFWDPTYTPFTFFQNDKAVANVSMFEMPMVVNGQKIIAAGIQSVMTDPQYRGKGLMKGLMKHALHYIDNNYELTFLMTSTPELYSHYGFQEVKEYYFVNNQGHKAEKNKNNLIQLDIFNKQDWERVRNMFNENHPCSEQFYPLSYESSFCLNMYNPVLHEMIYYSPEFNIILVFEIDDDTLELYDIIGKDIPTLEQIYSVMPYTFKNTNVYFNPDLLKEDFTPIEYKDSDVLMIRGDISFEDILVKLPITAEF